MLRAKSKDLLFSNKLIEGVIVDHRDWWMAESTNLLRPVLMFFGSFTAPHGPLFITAPKIFQRRLLSKGAVTTAPWQPCTVHPPVVVTMYIPALSGSPP